MVKTLHSQCGGEGHGFKSLSGNLRSNVSCGVKSKQNRSLKMNKIENIKKKKKKIMALGTWLMALSGD